MLYILSMVFVFALIGDANSAELLCKDIDGFGTSDGFGPYDYRSPENLIPPAGSNAKSKYEVVEGRHFTPDVENLVRGRTSTSPFPDIDYTLYRFPNHPKALWAMSRLERSRGLQNEVNSKVFASSPFYTECYFMRAIKFASDDWVVKMLFAMHYHKTKDFIRSENMYKQALAIEPNSAELNYNAGLMYFEISDYERANEFAKKAQDLGHPLGGLKGMLDKKGVLKR